MGKLKFRIQDDEVVFPTDQEQIADALADVMASLKHIKDPLVWGGYPDGWPDNADEEDDPRATIGLVLNLERCTRYKPTWQMARAIDIAFSLGKIAEGGEPTLKMMARIRADDARRRKASERSATARKKTAAAWHDEAESLALQELEQNPRLGLKALKQKAWERVRIKRPNGKWFPAEASVGDVLKERLRGKLARSHKQP